MKTYRYESYTAHKEGEDRHPLRVIGEILKSDPDLKVTAWTAHPIGDCWIFQFNKELPEPVPKFLADVTKYYERSGDL